ncbi:DUF421 domain-containing protein [Clostridium intestinale]|uniref:YetF C-terminal domain-containing protein n=2 Tax=Clostridium intestinale TaxID=36845 RepID=U2NKH3_9CLOT|nr:DUF421 domain-containing protein [Clostridium intestinale]ERK29623.1 hypothetical protein CINTURNW_3106 [Clostridium intestinale URNW]QLY80945.1 DUF421 domain-containing protein [Clostridium intestinale]
MFIVLIRTCILYILVVLVIRLMGKRQIGELQPYELVITIVISDLATVPMQDVRLPLILGIIPILTLLILEVFFTELQIRSKFMRKLIDGDPSVLIRDGKINEKALKSQRIHVEDLLEELRLTGNFDISSIKYAILESNGQLSIMSKENNENRHLPLVLLYNGKVNKDSLKKLHKDVKWLQDKVSSKNLSMNEIFIIIMDSSGKLQYQAKGEFEKLDGENT